MLYGYELPPLFGEYTAESDWAFGCETIPPRPLGMLAPFPAWLSFASVGNGDELGCYWPYGTQADTPLVMSSSHDVYGVIPEASSFAAMIRLHLVTETWDLEASGELDEINAQGGFEHLARMDEDELEDDAAALPLIQDLGTKIREMARAHANQGTVLEPGPQPQDPSARVRRLLSHDPESPFLLTAHADLLFGEAALDEAFEAYQQALAMLPQYTAARYGLAIVYRRQERSADAYRGFLRTLGGPSQLDGRSFWSEGTLPLSRQHMKSKALHELRNNAAPPDLTAAEEVVYNALPTLNFVNAEKGWEAEAKVAAALAGAGHYLEAADWHIGTAPGRAWDQGAQFDVPGYLKEQAALFAAAGDAQRAQFLEGIAADPR